MPSIVPTKRTQMSSNPQFPITLRGRTDRLNQGRLATANTGLRGGRGKAAEDCRTPGRYRVSLRASNFRQVLRCASPLALWVGKATDCNLTRSAIQPLG